MCKTLTEKIRKKLALLAGNVGMSFKQIAHPTFWALVLECMKEMNEGVPAEYQKDPQKLITPPTDKQVSAIVNDEGPKEKKSVYERNKGEKGTLSFDGGEFGHVPYYCGVLYFPHKPHEPPTVVCFKKGISSQAEMAEVAVQVLVEVSEYIDVTNVVLDGLFRQMQAFALFPSESSKEPNFQDTLPADFPNPLPFVVPDLPHLFNLSLTHLKEKPDFLLGKYTDDVNSICTEIRKKDAVTFIGIRCPTYSRTRFFHIVLELSFMEKNKARISDYYAQFALILLLCVLFFFFFFW
jgi:hypothetical protein